MLLLHILCLIILSRVDARTFLGRTCDDFQANFTTQEVVGAWYVVAIIPERMFPDIQRRITCYRVDFSETDRAGLRWLMNNTFYNRLKAESLRIFEGTIIRQRYNSEKPFDVWSKSVEGINGCFQQVLSLDTDKTELSKAISHDDMMQLHLMDTGDERGPFLLQMLWGKMISVVIYRRQLGATQEELKPVYEFITEMRGLQRIPRICDSLLEDVRMRI